MRAIKQRFWLLSLLVLTGCFVNYPVYYDQIIKTEKSLPGFVSFAKEKNIRYKSSLGSPRNLGMVSSSMIPLESYGDIFEDQIPGKAGVDVETKNCRQLPFHFWGAQTGTIPVSIKGQMREKSKKAIIILHGLLFSKRTVFIREFAEVAYSQWNFTIITIDLRGHGENLIYPETSVGVYEALDVCYLAKKLKTECGMEYVGVIGFSYGAHTAIRVAYEASCEAKASGGLPVIDAAVAISPPCDMNLAFYDLSSTGIGYVTNNFFSGLFLARVAALKKSGFIQEDLEIKNFKDYLDRVVIPRYKYDVPPVQRRLSKPL
jgi:predicted alpha/beta-fold hydrolase